MLRLALIATLALIALFMFGCDKEKIVESTEYVQETEYVQLPPDTVFQTDTVVVGSGGTDTVIIVDTVNINGTDTVRIVDTVNVGSSSPNSTLAFAALVYQTNYLVLEFIYSEYGVSDGWIFYLNEHQSEVTVQSTNVYDIYGLIDYWTTDWSAFEPLEFYWRMTYTGGDPSDPGNWTLSDPPDAAPHDPGIKAIERPATTTRLLK